MALLKLVIDRLRSQEFLRTEVPKGTFYSRYPRNSTYAWRIFFLCVCVPFLTFFLWIGISGGLQYGLLVSGESVWLQVSQFSLPGTSLVLAQESGDPHRWSSLDILRRETVSGS